MAIPWSFWTKGLILGARGDTVPGKRGEKPFLLLVARQAGRKLLDEVAIAFDPSAATLLRLQRQIFRRRISGSFCRAWSVFSARAYIHEQLVHVKNGTTPVVYE